MKRYIGTKIVHASPCTKGPEGPEGYSVVYQDGYESWSPKDVFEAAYRETTGMNFGLAVEALKEGMHVLRADWAGVRYLALFDAVEGGSAEFAIKHFDDRLTPFALLTSDVLADDWQIVE